MKREHSSTHESPGSVGMAGKPDCGMAWANCDAMPNTTNPSTNYSLVSTSPSYQPNVHCGLVLKAAPSRASLTRRDRGLGSGG